MRNLIVILLIVGFTMASVPRQMRWMVADHWFDQEQNLVTIQLDEDIDASDADCEMAARLFHEICKQGYTLRVLPYKHGGFVPSRVNPMTEEWTNVLIDPEVQ